MDSHDRSPTAASAPPSQDEARGASEVLIRLRNELAKRIVGQDEVIRLVLAAILSEGHCLVVGLPGLAKTLLVSSVAQCLSLAFKRIQFTPDLLPSDITGATIIESDTTGQRDLRFLKGPIFANVVLADEINRTPPKTQAALIEAMEERQVSVAGKRLALARPFFVLATQNPIELEGTYPLPVSQLDRFLFSIPVDYPSPAEEFRMVVLTTSTYSATIQPVIDEAGVLGLIRLASAVEVSEEIYEYASRLVRSTRPASGEATTFSKEFVAWGGGPRATKALVGAARALALMEARTRVEVDDLRQVLVPALRHRIVPRYHAQAEGIRCEDIIGKIVEEVPAPGSGRTPASALPS